MPAKRKMAFKKGKKAKPHVTTDTSPPEHTENIDTSQVHPLIDEPRSPTPPPAVDVTSAAPRVSLGSSRPPADRKRRSQLPEHSPIQGTESTESEEEEQRIVYPHSKKRLVSTMRQPLAKNSTLEKDKPKKPLSKKATTKKAAPRKAKPKKATPRKPTPKKAARYYNTLKKLTEEEEDRLREMIGDAEFVYNKEGEGYANRDRKKDFWDNCDNEFFDGVFGSSLKWYRNKRTVFGKLKTRERYKKSGSGARINHEQQKLMEEWRFLSRHMDPIEYRCGVNLRKARDARYGVSYSTDNEEELNEEISEDESQEFVDLSARKTTLIERKRKISHFLNTHTDDCQLHGDYLASMMRNMIPELRTDFVHESLQLALDYQKRGLKMPPTSKLDTQPSGFGLLSQQSSSGSLSQPSSSGSLSQPSNSGPLSHTSSSFGSQMQQDRFLAQQIADSNPPIPCIPPDQMWMQNYNASAVQQPQHFQQQQFQRSQQLQFPQARTGTPLPAVTSELDQNL